VNRRTCAFFAVVGAPPIALAVGAAIMMFGAMSGRHLMWRATDHNLVSAIQNQNPIAVKVFVEALPSIDTPVPFSHPRILNFQQMELAPLAIALLQDHGYVVEVLRESGSDPAKALGQIPAETAAALLRYATETHNTLAVDYLTKYRVDLVNPAPAGR
jgi:hypothetical protein